MKINKNELDEMQKERRNKIGNQMFMVMFYAIFLDCGLFGIGFRWLNYPANIMVILMVCMSIYLVRIIAANSYLPPKAQSRKTLMSVLAAIIFSVVFAAACYNLFGNIPANAAEDTGDNSAMILFIVSAVGLIISLIVAVIKKLNDKNDSDD